MLILNAVATGKWKPMEVNRGGLKISHLLFVDDIILFAKDTSQQALVIKQVVEMFCHMSGQTVSIAKSAACSNQFLS